MFRAFTGAFSLALTIMILRLFLPEIFGLVIQVTVQALEIISAGLDLMSQGQYPY